MYRPAFTRAQREALYNLWLRNNSGEKAVRTRQKRIRLYRKFRRTAHYAAHLGCVIIQWNGMTVGIETDGYTHC